MNHAVLLDDKKMIGQRIHYTHENPARTQIVSHAKDYLWDSALDSSGKEGYIDVVIIVK